MKTHSVPYYFLLFIFILTPIGLGYYIFLNTVLANSVLPNLRLNSKDISFYSKDELAAKIEEEALSNLPERATIKFEDSSISLPTKDLNFKVDTYDLVNYGKGNDLFKVIAEGLNLIKGVDVNVSYSFNTDNLFSKLGLNLESLDPSKLTDQAYVCNKDNYQFVSIDKTRLANDFSEFIKLNKEFRLNLSEYITDLNENNIYITCLKYKFEENKIKRNLIEALTTESINLNDYFVVNLQNNKPIWQIKDINKLAELIDKAKSQKDVPIVEGYYEVQQDKILMYLPYSEGQTIDKEATLSSINAWINSEDLQTNPIIYTITKPKILDYSLPIYHFTKLIGQGTTRIELKRNGFDNFVIPYTMFGLDEINKTIVNAGEEFSYLNTIQPQPNGTTKSGRPINGGICNSTTTLFRAILETGLPVTDRSYHAYNVESYSWGYPLNIVDAAYYTKPQVDFKFKNDLEDPILIMIEYSKDEDYQYNTVKIYSSSIIQKREVELENWKVWDKFSATNFKGSFDRTVSIDGKVIFTDSFYSHYL